VLPIFYPNMYERDNVQEVDPEVQATGSTSLTMHPGILLGLSEYYCKAPRVVLRAYLVSVFLVRGGRCTVSYSVVPCCDQFDTLAVCSFAPPASRFWSSLTRCVCSSSALPGRLPLRPGLPEPGDAGRAVQRGPAVLPGDAAQLLHAGHDLAQAHCAAAEVSCRIVLLSGLRCPVPLLCFAAAAMACGLYSDRCVPAICSSALLTVSPSPHRDMDEWSFALLSCKVFVRCHLAGSVIYHKGETSDYAYVILGGSVKVRVYCSLTCKRVASCLLCLLLHRANVVGGVRCCVVSSLTIVVCVPSTGDHGAHLGEEQP
jgi:hypothetical protein